MFGNMMSGKRIRATLGDTANDIRIKPYRGAEVHPLEERIGASTLTLYAGAVRYQVPVTSSAHWEELDLQDGAFSIEPGQYVKVTPTECVICPDGIVARYEPTSDLIDEGFDLIAGKLDPRYGTDGEVVVFGLQNISSVTRKLTRNTRIAHMTFFDLRAISESLGTDRLWRKRTPDDLARMPLLVPTDNEE